MASITEEAKSALASQDQDFHEDVPSLFFHVVSQLFTATFSNAQATRDNLSGFHPKWFRYDVIQVNNYISSAVMTLKAASSAGGTITDQEILYFQFKIYKKIEAPAEWTTHILFLESTVASTQGYTPETLFNKTQAKYTTLLNQGLWKPSNKTPEEQTLAMVAQQQQAKKSSNNPTKSKPNSTQRAKPTEKDKIVLLLPLHQANWAIPSSGMARPTTGALPTSSTPTGTHTKWRSATLTRKCSRNKTSLRVKTKRKSLWMKTNSRRAWPPTSHPVTSILMIWLKLLPQP